MKQLCSFSICALLLSAAPLTAWTNPTLVTGDYVEVRTAEVYTGGCILGSEWESLGRDAIMAWRVSSGAVNGASLDGLSVVAVVSGDRNLGAESLGALPPSVVKAVMLVDERATAAQRDALLAMARGLAPSLTRDIIDIKAVPISFARDGADVKVTAAEARLDVTTTFDHSPTCGATRWFDPLAQTTKAELGLARSHEWSGAAPGATWVQTDRKAAFVGSFTYAR